MKIGILYIAIGQYDMFWRDFYKSSETYFLPGIEKHYYVFTDAEKIYREELNNIHKIYQEDLGWPGNTLFRFKIFAKHMMMYADMDYLFFFNANLEFKQIVGSEVLTEKEVLVVQHFGYREFEPDNFPYDRNRMSLAYIPHGIGKVYVCGGFNGGPRQIYEEMILELKNNIDIDYKNGVIARWHDESHINKYIISHAYKMLHPGYVHPQGWYRLPFPCKILLKDKVIAGGRIFLKQKNYSYRQQIIYYARYIYNMFRKH